MRLFRRRYRQMGRPRPTEKDWAQMWATAPISYATRCDDPNHCDRDWHLSKTKPERLAGQDGISYEEQQG